jgi:hypothetical protein
MPNFEKLFYNSFFPFLIRDLYSQIGVFSCVCVNVFVFDYERFLNLFVMKGLFLPRTICVRR